MKTSNWLKIGSLPVALSLAIAGCGDGGSNNIQSLPNFQLGDFDILKPLGNSVDACLFPKIQIQVEERIVQAMSQNINSFLRLRSKDESEEWELIEAFVPAGVSSAPGKRIIETAPKTNLLPNTEYILEKAQNSAGVVTFDLATARVFTTGSFQDNRACPGNLRIVENGSKWRKTTALDLGSFDENGDLILDPTDLGEMLLSAGIENLISGLTGLGAASADNFFEEIEFNSAIRDLGLESRILIFRMISFGQQIQELQQPFQPADFLTGCDGPNGRCIYQDPSRPRVAIVSLPPGGWTPGTYFMVVTERMRSLSGRFPDGTYYTTFKVQ